MTVRNQKRKAVAELASGEFEASNSENNLVANLLAGPSKQPSNQTEKLDENKTSLRREILSDRTKILADNQKEIKKLITPVTERSSDHQAFENSDSESENISVAPTSTPVRTEASKSKTTPINSRNKHFSEMTAVFDTFDFEICPLLLLEKLP